MRRKFVSVLSGLLMAGAAWGAPLPALHTDKNHFVDEQDRPVLLKGCNLGNWLMFEGWMFGGTLSKDRPGGGFKDGATVYRTLRERFGEEKSAELIKSYRDNWITPRDFEQIKSFGFNVVRLPFDYRTITEDAPPFATKPDAFVYLDKCVDMAEAAGLYTILDLHGAPGGQSMEDHTGEAGQDHLWDRPENQKHTVEVWRKVSEHFKNRTSVAAYDLVNEPYGNHKGGHNEDVKPVMKTLMPDCTRAIRDNGDQHIVFFSGVLGGFGIKFYDNPHEQNLTNVAFTEHFYPGMFGSKPAIETHARQLNFDLPQRQAYAEKMETPYYVGEFNVVFDTLDGPRLMREYYDRFTHYGWAGTMWSYKLLSSGGGVGENVWYMTTNAEPMAKLDLDTATYEQLHEMFASLGTMKLATNERLRTALTEKSPKDIFLRKDFADAKPGGESLLKSDAWKTGDNVTWQDLDVTPGERFEASVDSPAGKELEVRLEAITEHGPVTINFEKSSAQKTGALKTDSTAYTGKLRVLVVGSTNAEALKPSLRRTE